MAGVINGQSVSSEVTDPAFIFKNAPDQTNYKVGFLDTIGVGMSASDVAEVDIDANDLIAIRATSESDMVDPELLFRHGGSSGGNLPNGSNVGTWELHGRTNGSYNILARIRAAYKGSGMTSGTDIEFYNASDVVNTDEDSSLFLNMVLKANGNLLIGTQTDTGYLLNANGPASIQKLNQLVTTQATTGTPITALSSSNGFVVFTGSTATTIQGIAAPTQSVCNGTTLFVQNRSSADITFKNQNGSASAANRIVLPNATDFTVAADTGATFVYDQDNSRWRLLASAGGTFSGILPISQGGTGQTNPSDAFNALSPMTTGGDLIYGGTSGHAQRLANGTSGQYLMSNGGTSAPSWQSQRTVLTKSANYTIGNTEDSIIADTSSGSFNLTLPAVSSFLKRDLTIINQGTNFETATILAAGGDTIFGSALSTTQFLLNTDAQAITLFGSSGVWYVMDHKIPSTWISYTPSYNGFGTVSSASAQWRRVGDSIEIQGRFTAGTSTASEAQISLPPGLSSSATIPSPLVVAGNYAHNATTNQRGGFTLIEPSVGHITFSSPITFSSSATGINPTTKVNGNDIVSNPNGLVWFAKLQITNWEG